MILDSDTNKRQPLTADEARAMLGWENASDQEVEEFLTGIRNWASGYLDDYFKPQDL